MKISFFGAAREVTGSLYMIEVNDRRVLLECGLFQGHRADEYERNLHFPFDPKSIDAMILSHAHIDHSGNIPNLVRQGFRGNIWCTPPTRNLSTYMLLDSGSIQENDINYLNRQRAKKNQPPAAPIYTKADAQASLEQFVTVGLHRRQFITDGLEVTFHNAGHILGSAIPVIDVQERAAGRSIRLVFSGDLGRREASILREPELVDSAEVLLIESTYGDRLHTSLDETRRQLRDVIRETARRRGKVIIPAFAVERTQEIVYAINRLEAEGDIPVLPVFVDSPLAVNATEVFRLHPEAWDEDVQAFLADENRTNPFDSTRIEYVRDVRKSKQLNFLSEPAIIISASGMAENGRILHHLKNNIERAENTILFVGYQAQNTLGRRNLDGNKRARIFGEEYEVRAHVASIDGYSAHADQAELLDWARGFDRQRLQRVFVIHGEEPAALTFAEKLRQEGLRDVVVPERSQVFEL
jgi:metallo-beta-lactamase family protein